MDVGAQEMEKEAERRAANLLMPEFFISIFVSI